MDRGVQGCSKAGWRRRWKEDPGTGQTRGLGVRIAELNLFAPYFGEQDKTDSV